MPDETVVPSFAPELYEELSSIQHDIWAHWQRYLHSKLLSVTDPEDGHVLYYRMDLDWFERWERQATTPYAELTPAERASDREQVNRYWPLLGAFFEQFLEGFRGQEMDPAFLVHRWREELDSIAWESCPACGSFVRKNSIEAGHKAECSLVPRL